MADRTAPRWARSIVAYGVALAQRARRARETEKPRAVGPGRIIAELRDLAEQVRASPGVKQRIGECMDEAAETIERLDDSSVYATHRALVAEAKARRMARRMAEMATDHQRRDETWRGKTTTS